MPFSRIFSFFLQFWGFEGDFKTRAKPRYAPNSGWNAFRKTVLRQRLRYKSLSKNSPLKRQPVSRSFPLHKGPSSNLNAGKSHPWTNTSVGGNFQRTFRTIGPYEFPQEKVWTNDWSIWLSPEMSMDPWSWKFSESFSLDWYWSIECSSLEWAVSLNLPSWQFSLLTVPWNRPSTKGQLRGPWYVLTVLFKFSAYTLWISSSFNLPFLVWDLHCEFMLEFCSQIFI